MAETIIPKTREQQVEELLAIFGDEARAAYENGGEWSYTPDCVETGNEFVDLCDDCDDWHRSWTVPGYRIEGGKLYQTYDSVDDSGDWDFLDDFEVGADGFEAWDRQYNHEAARESWRAYYEDVVETGEDPLDALIVPYAKIDQKWYFWVTSQDAGCKVEKVTKGKPTGRNLLAKTPDNVKQFLALHDRDGGVYVGALGEFLHPDHLQDTCSQTAVKEWFNEPDGSLRGMIVLKVDPSPAIIRHKTTVAARRVLREDKF